MEDDNNVKQKLSEPVMSEAQIATLEGQVATLADACIEFNDGLLSIITLAEQNRAEQEPSTLKALLDGTLRSIMDVFAIEDGYAEIQPPESELISSERGKVPESKVSHKSNCWKVAREALAGEDFFRHVNCYECEECHCQYDSVLILLLATPESSQPMGFLLLFIRGKNIRAESVRIAEVICRISAGMIYSRLYEDRLRSEREGMVAVARSFSHGMGRYLTTMRRWIDSWPESEKPKGKQTILFLEQRHDNRLILLKLIRGSIDRADVQEGLLRLNIPIMNWIINSVVDSYSFIADTEGKKIHANLPSSESAEPSSAVVNYCAGLIELVVTNLVSNAVKYAEKDAVINFKTVTFEEQEQPQYIIIIEDDGPGFVPEIREQIFGIDDYTAQEIMAKEDRGLGLPLSLMVTHRYLNGDIICEESTQGARLVFKFPLRLEELEV